MTSIEYFIDFLCRGDIETMRKIGLNDVQIGWILYSVRTAAIKAENLYHENQRRRYTDFNVTGFEIADMIADRFKEKN